MHWNITMHSVNIFYENFSILSSPDQLGTEARVIFDIGVEDTYYKTLEKNLQSIRDNKQLVCGLLMLKNCWFWKTVIHFAKTPNKRNTLITFCFYFSKKMDVYIEIDKEMNVDALRE